MALKAIIEGTLGELSDLWRWDVLSELVNVDYYNRCRVPATEVFTITEDDLKRVLLKDSN